MLLFGIGFILYLLKSSTANGGFLMWIWIAVIIVIGRGVRTLGDQGESDRP